jgi:GGDEF domain-containing protein
MSFICQSCGKDCRPLGNNVIGVEIQEHTLEKGWTSASEPYKTLCEARIALRRIPEDSIERRVYSAFRKAEISMEALPNPTTINIGVATLARGEGCDELFQRADDAMCRAKLAGLKRVGMTA